MEAPVRLRAEGTCPPSSTRRSSHSPTPLGRNHHRRRVPRRIRSITTATTPAPPCPPWNRRAPPPSPSSLAQPVRVRRPTRRACRRLRPPPSPSNLKATPVSPRCDSSRRTPNPMRLLPVARFLSPSACLRSPPLPARPTRARRRSFLGRSACRVPPAWSRVSRRTSPRHSSPAADTTMDAHHSRSPSAI